MMYSVEMLQPAWRDLERIADMHMSLAGVNSAKRFADGFLDSIDNLSSFPFDYPIVPDEELAEAGCRMLIYNLSADVPRL